MFDIYSAEKSSRLKQQYCVTFLEQAQAVSPYIKQVESRGSDDSFGMINTVSDIKNADDDDVFEYEALIDGKEVVLNAEDTGSSTCMMMSPNAPIATTRLSRRT